MELPAFAIVRPVEDHPQPDDDKEERPPGMKKFAEVKFQVTEAIEEQDRAESDENQAPYDSGKAAMHNLASWGGNG
ncbi:MAG: hypothetical protein A2W25_04050 [candidate division Zixibacteria bacterium RBG_16_53_22]|nr:MAG: hypothetical protein A2W25_04050 [candidate division Zixibacteria bacterium RBG_16_53_22]